MVYFNGNPNPFPQTFSVTVSASDVFNFDLYGICTGDYTGSYVPSGAKSATASLSLVYGDHIQAAAGQDIQLPVFASEAMEVGAVSMILQLPSNLAEVTGVEVVGSNEEVSYSVNGDELRIGWNSAQAVNIAANAELLRIHLRTTDRFTAGQSIALSLTSDPLNELADASFNVIPNAVLITEVVDNLATGIQDPLASKISLDNYPNPFSSVTNIRYTLPSEGHVRLEFFNLLGQQISTLLDKEQSAGNYSLKLDGTSLEQGVYFVVLHFRNDSCSLTKQIKLVVNK